MGLRLSSLLIAIVTIAAASGVAQEQPSVGRSSGLGLYGFAARGGVDFEGSGQAVASVALDAGHLFTERVRLRPSGEIGFLSGDNTYLVSFEVLFRITDDQDIAVPYLGTGLGLWGRAACAADDGCPGLWLQFVLGFEVPVREGMAWMVEYHPADAFRRNRVLVGLTTRRGR